MPCTLKNWCGTLTRYWSIHRFGASDRSRESRWLTLMLPVVDALPISNEQNFTAPAQTRQVIGEIDEPLVFGIHLTAKLPSPLQRTA